MNFSIVATLVVAIYAVAAIGYVYRWRGQARYPTFSEYLRKSWPIFAPLNCLLYLATHRQARLPVLDAGYLHGIARLREAWPQIRAEGLALHQAAELEATTTPGSAGYHDLGFRTFYKRGWKKFYLKWYGTPHRSAQRLCPTTVRLLEQVPGIRAAMFSLLPAGAELSLHSDPMACSLRYHLGLETPESERCYINVDGQSLSWRNGQDFVFDETYPHYARNDTDSMRLILMCDVERPMNPLGRLLNRMYSRIPRAMTVPNTAEDRRGVISWAFSKLAPLRSTAIALKESNRTAYRLLKLCLNGSLLLLAGLLVYVALGVLAQAMPAFSP